MSNFTSKVTISAIDKLSKPVKAMAKSLDGLKTHTRSLSAGLSQVSSAGADVGRKMRNMGILVTAAGGALFALVKSTANAGDDLAKNAQRVGVSVEALQKFAFAAELGGATSSEMANALKFLNKSMSDARKGTGEQFEALAAMGIALDDAEGQAKSTGEVLLEIADKFQQAEDGAAKTATAMTLFGRAGTQIIPMLNEGKEAIEAHGRALEATGAIMSEEAAKKSEAFNDSITVLMRNISALKMEIGLELMPTIHELVTSITEYLMANKEIISQNLTRYMRTLADTLKQVWSGLQSVWKVLSPLIDAFGGFQNIVIALAGVYLAGLLVSLGKLAFAIGLVGKSLLLLTFTPLGALAAGVAGIVAIFMNWEKILEKISKLWGKVKGAFKKWRGGGAEEGMEAAEPKEVKLGKWWKRKVVGEVGDTQLPENALLGSQTQRSANAGILSGASMQQSSAAINQRLAQTPQLSPQKQSLDISMKIDSEGRPRIDSVKSDSEIEFNADMGVLMPTY